VTSVRLRALRRGHYPRGRIRVYDSPCFLVNGIFHRKSFPELRYFVPRETGMRR